MLKLPYGALARFGKKLLILIRAEEEELSAVLVGNGFLYELLVPGKYA